MVLWLVVPGGGHLVVGVAELAHADAHGAAEIDEQKPAGRAGSAFDVGDLRERATGRLGELALGEACALAQACQGAAKPFELSGLGRVVASARHARRFRAAYSAACSVKNEQTSADTARAGAEQHQRRHDLNVARRWTAAGLALLVMASVGMAGMLAPDAGAAPGGPVVESAHVSFYPVDAEHNGAQIDATVAGARSVSLSLQVAEVSMKQRAHACDARYWILQRPLPTLHLRRVGASLWRVRVPRNARIINALGAGRCRFTSPQRTAAGRSTPPSPGMPVMSSRRNGLHAAVAVVLAGLALAGCGGSRPTASSSRGSGAPEPATAPGSGAQAAAPITQTSTCQDWVNAPMPARMPYVNNSPDLEQQINQLCDQEPNKSAATVEGEYETACADAQGDPSSPVDRACGQ
jgi:hypothetical protein